MTTPATTLRRLAVLRTVTLNGIPTPEARDADAQLASLAPELADAVVALLDERDGARKRANDLECRATERHHELCALADIPEEARATATDAEVDAAIAALRHPHSSTVECPACGGRGHRVYSPGVEDGCDECEATGRVDAATRVAELEARAAKAEAALAATEALLHAFSKAVPACEKCQKQPATRQYRFGSAVMLICDDNACLPGVFYRRLYPVHDTPYGAELRAALAARRRA